MKPDILQMPPLSRGGICSMQELDHYTFFYSHSIVATGFGLRS